jgi:hypothetical protein
MYNERRNYVTRKQIFKKVFFPLSLFCPFINSLKHGTHNAYIYFVLPHSKPVACAHKNHPVNSVRFIYCASRTEHNYAHWAKRRVFVKAAGVYDTLVRIIRRHKTGCAEISANRTTRSAKRSWLTISNVFTDMFPKSPALRDHM